MFNVPDKLGSILISILVPTLLWLAHNNTLNPGNVEMFLYAWYSILLLLGVFCLAGSYYGKVIKGQKLFAKKLELTPVYGIVIQAFNLYFLFTLYGPVLPIMMVVALRMLSDSYKYIQFRIIQQLAKPA